MVDMENGSLVSEIKALEKTVLGSVKSSSALEEVAAVWDKLGLSDSIRQTRRQALANNIGDLLNEIVQGEQNLEKTMLSSLETNLKELTALCHQLSLPPEQFSETLCLYEKEKSTRHRVDALNKIKFDREKRLKRIVEMELALCKELGEQAEVCASKKQLPSEEELRGYLKRVETLEQTLAQRRKQRLGLIGKVKEVVGTLELELGDEYALLTEGDFVYSKQHVDDMEAAYVKFEAHIRGLERETNELREAVHTLWERLEIPQREREQVLQDIHSFKPSDISLLREELERLTVLKKQHMEAFIVKTREELQQVWDQCLYGKQQRREFAPAFIQGPFNDDLLSVHESEVDRMRGYYKDNAAIYTLIEKREAMFNQFCELERRDSDPSRFSNRGGQLLKDQAQKKQLNKEIPQVEKTLKEMLKSWEDDHERLFMVRDDRYIDTIEQQWKEKETSKTMEKAKRQKAKEVTTFLEMTYGSKPSTPKALKRQAASPLPPSTAPIKVRKVDASPCTRPVASSGSRLPRGKALARTNAKSMAQTPLRSSSQRSDRRKILADRNVAGSASSGDETASSCHHNLSLASTLSYSDFQHGIMAPKRSTAFPKNSSHVEQPPE